MGYKKLSNKQELQLIEEYKNGCSVNGLMNKYGFKTKKSITDKIKKHYPENYKEIIKIGRDNRKTYCYKFEKIQSEFDAYFLGLLLTDGYIVKNKNSYQIGIDLTDEDCIQFLSKTLHKPYHSYKVKEHKINGKLLTNLKDKHRLILQDNELANNLKRYGVIERKSKIIQGVPLDKSEEKYIPYIIRGIIDGDGTVSPTSYKAPQFKIYSASLSFLQWIKQVLENKMYMKDISITIPTNNAIGYIETADQDNIQKLITLSYNKPFGMKRKYDLLRKTFRDYNGISFLEDKRIKV